MPKYRDRGNDTIQNVRRTVCIREDLDQKLKDQALRKDVTYSLLLEKILMAYLKVTR